jgi:hypothetical protein
MGEYEFFECKDCIEIEGKIPLDDLAQLIKFYKAEGYKFAVCSNPEEAIEFIKEFNCKPDKVEFTNEPWTPNTSGIEWLGRAELDPLSKNSINKKKKWYKKIWNAIKSILKIIPNQERLNGCL